MFGIASIFSQTDIHTSTHSSHLTAEKAIVRSIWNDDLPSLGM
ncbi:hypothetical protein ALP86_04083 [Pseudomonas amygdali pv. mori]|uniref:Uncharacterized protein n=1 Tax=Pseudomonas amygdali pv. mori TaxID=34065 RepID=A0A3M4UV86_PSEA0|nr:hypothetical protein ALQ05_01331 [Pseudomonas amygdali pv. mori]RMR43445.1 hypothetical protein ALP86_04083 [Pseudomonas amygdali pv. mori]